MTTVHSEREAKFEGTGRFDPRDLKRLPAVARMREETPEELDAVYYDTADLRLLTHGVTLRRRSGGHDAGWHVKTPADDGARAEVHAPLRAGKPGAVPGELARRVAVYARGRDLLPVAHLRTHRRRYLLLDERDRCLAEVAEDGVAAQALDTERLSPRRPGRPPAKAARESDGGTGTRTRITQWSEIEVELEDGGPGLLRAAARRLGAAGWRPSLSAHKLGHALADELALIGDGTGRADERMRSGSAGEAVMARLGEQVTELLRIDPRVRVDEPDAVHQMRTTSRRLRNLLRSHRRLLDRARTDPVAGELRRLTGLLAEARDHEVLAARLHRQAEHLREEGRPAVEGLAERVRDQERARHDTVWREAVEALDSPRYFALLDALDALRSDPPLRRRARKPAVKELRKAAERDRLRLASRLAAAQSAPEGADRDQALHSARKAARRARHCAETALPYGGKRALRLRKRTKAVQQVLGECQDAAVTRSALPELAAEAHRRGADTFGYGLLYAAQDEEARTARDRLPEAGRKACDPRLTRFT